MNHLTSSTHTQPILTPTNSLIPSNQTILTPQKLSPTQKNYIIPNYPSQTFIRFLSDLGQNVYKPVNIQNYSSMLSLNQQNKLVTFQNVENYFKKINSIKQIKKNWSKQDSVLLLWIVEKFRILQNKKPQQFNSDDWNKISRLIPSKNSNQCIFKWLNLQQKQSIQKFKWTQTEDIHLKRLIITMTEQKPKKWHQISKNLYLSLNIQNKVYRTGKQCRERWASFLNPNLKKTSWQIQQDQILLSQFLKIGKRWASISKKIIGRTENAVKNRFYLILSKKSKSKYKKCSSIGQFIKYYLQNLMKQNMKSRSKKLQIIKSQEYLIQQEINVQDEGYKVKKEAQVTKIEREMCQDKDKEIYDSKIIEQRILMTDNKYEKYDEIKSSTILSVQNMSKITGLTNSESNL